MFLNKGTKEMYNRFPSIINNLKSHRKVYSDEEIVKKLLKTLPKNPCGDKVTMVEEAQDWNTLKLKDLVGKLLTYEIHLWEEQRKTLDRGIALKTIVSNPKSKAELESIALEDEIVMLALVFHKILKRRQRYKILLAEAWK